MRGPNKTLAGVAAIAGVVVPAAGLLVLPIWAFPNTQQSGTALLVWTAHHQGRLQAVMVLNTVGVTLWLAFGALLRAVMRQSLAPDSALPDLFGAGFSAMVSLLLAGFTAFDVLVYRVNDLAPAEGRLLYDLTFGMLAMSGMPGAVALGAFTFAVRRHRIAPTSLGVLAGVTAVAHVALIGSLIVPSGPASLEDLPITVVPALLWAWILITGIVLTKRPTTADRDLPATR